jgi:hypothetical protein
LHLPWHDFVSPYTRLYDILESQGRLQELRGNPELLQELDLDVSTEELLSAERAFTYAELYEYAVLWLTHYASVVPVDGGVVVYPGGSWMGRASQWSSF